MPFPAVILKQFNTILNIESSSFPWSFWRGGFLQLYVQYHFKYGQNKMLSRLHGAFNMSFCSINHSKWSGLPNTCLTVRAGCRVRIQSSEWTQGWISMMILGSEWLIAFECFWEKKKKNIQTSTLRSSQCQKPAGQSQANIQALSLHGWMMPRYDSLLFFVFLASNVWTFTCYTFNDCLKHWQSIHWLQVGRNNLLKTT